MAPTKEKFLARPDLSTYVYVICLFQKVEKHDYHIDWTAKCTSLTTTLRNMPSLLFVPYHLTTHMAQLMTCEQNTCHLCVAQCFVDVSSLQLLLSDWVATLMLQSNHVSGSCRRCKRSHQSMEETAMGEEGFWLEGRMGKKLSMK